MRLKVEQKSFKARDSALSRRRLQLRSPNIMTSRPNRRDSIRLLARSSVKCNGVLGGRYTVQMTNDL